jgi:hypothetical protein
MKKLLILLIFLVCSVLTYSQTATATIGDYTQSPGTLTVPVTVTNFTGIGALTIFFEYDPAVVTFTTYNTPGLAGLQANGSYWASLDKYLVGITWSAATGATSGPVLVNVVFNYLGGAGNFTFMPSMSEVTFPSGLPLTVLYGNGSISPVTSASATLPQLLNQTPGANFFIPLNVNFSTVSGGVNNFTFVVQYDEAKLDFTSLETLAWTGIIATELTNPTGRVAIE